MNSHLGEWRIKVKRVSLVVRMRMHWRQIRVLIRIVHRILVVPHHCIGDRVIHLLFELFHLRIKCLASGLRWHAWCVLSRDFNRLSIYSLNELIQSLDNVLLLSGLRFHLLLIQNGSIVLSLIINELFYDTIALFERVVLYHVETIFKRRGLI